MYETPTTTVGSMRRSTLAVFVITAALGCSSSSLRGPDGGSHGASDSGRDLNAFIGTWTANSGTITLTCSGQITTAQVTGNDVWQIGTTSDLLQPADSSSSGCVVLANVSGDTATGLPNQTCALPTGGTTVDLTVTKYIFVLGSDGTAATETASGTGSVTNNGSTSTCSYAETATYIKE